MEDAAPTRRPIEVTMAIRSHFFSHDQFWGLASSPSSQVMRKGSL